MPQLAEETYISLPVAAQRLHCSWQVCWRKLLTWQLKGEQVGGRWRVTEESVRRAEHEQQSPQLEPAT
jgi:hypothetical protein